MHMYCVARAGTLAVIRSLETHDRKDTRMTTQKQVALELIGKHIAAYRELDVHNVYGERLTKAQAILEDAKVHRKADGSYLVESSTGHGNYRVNGQCECEDFVHKQAPNGWCKHRLAAKTYQVVLDDMIALQRAGVPHLHFACEHASRTELCWARGCEEPMDQLCASCLVEMDAQPATEVDVSRTAAEALARSLAPETEWTETEDVDLDPNHPLCDCVGAHDVGCPMLDLPGAALEATVPPLVTAQYEENPQAYVCAAPGKGKKSAADAKPLPMPEAPASLNIQLNLPRGGKLMYTMRSVLQSHEGDVELAERLAVVLPQLEAVVTRLQNEHVGRCRSDDGAF